MVGRLNPSALGLTRATNMPHRVMNSEQINKSASASQRYQTVPAKSQIISSEEGIKSNRQRVPSFFRRKLLSSPQQHCSKGIRFPSVWGKQAQINDCKLNQSAFTQWREVRHPGTALGLLGRTEFGRVCHYMSWSFLQLLSHILDEQKYRVQYSTTWLRARSATQSLSFLFFCCSFHHKCLIFHSLLENSPFPFKTLPKHDLL